MNSTTYKPGGGLKGTIIFFAVLIIIFSIIIGIAAAVLSWNMIVSNPGKYLSYSEKKQANSVFKVICISILLALLLNIGFSLLLVASAVILVDVKKIDSEIANIRKMLNLPSSNKGDSNDRNEN